MPRCVSSQSKFLRLEGVVWIIGRAIIVGKINVGMCSVAQSCPTLCSSHGLQPTRLLCPWDSSGKNTGVGCHSLLQMCYAAAAAAKSLQSCLTLCDPIDGSPQAPPSLGFFRQEYWSGLPFPSPNVL